MLIPKQELEQIANLCEQLESHLLADEEGFELTKKLVDTIVDDSKAKMKIDDDETEEDDFLRSEEKSACLAKHNAESLLQRMFMKMTKIGEDEMAGKVGDAISSLYEIKRTRRRKKKSVKSIGDEKKKKKDARRRSASTSEEEEEDDDDDDDDERTIELKAVACSQIGAEATQRNPEVQTFRMRKNKEVEVCVHESSWSDAGLAFRIWGAARVAFRVVDFASEYFIEKEKTCLELGSGCGLIGAAIASLDGGRCTVTEGAPGALAALRKTALGVNEASKKESMKVAFLDWRDDLAALEEEKNGTVECIVNIIANAQSTKSPTPSFSPYSTCNFVHANKATFENAHVNMRLQDDARFDCLVGSDLMYDRQHCTALAASVARRLRPNGEAIIFLAVRSEELLIAFGKKCARRGLSVGVYAPTKPHEDLEDFSETTGGHANRPLPESCNEYWDLVAEKFSTCLLSKDYASFAPLLSSSSSLKDEDETSARRITLEGRFAMVRVVVAEKEEEKEQKQQQEVESEENDDESLKGVPVGDVKSMRVKL